MSTRVPRFSLATRPLVPCLIVLSCLIVPTLRAQDAPAPSEQAPPATSAARLIELNRGIRAYIERDLDAARSAFEQVLAQEPQNPACLYYLGLINMEEGLKLSTSDKEAARVKFDEARSDLEKITHATDPTVIPVEAALLLGIAQLAADIQGEMGAILELAQSAHDTLKNYVENIDAGKSDRYGHFYLGVACYRLGDYYSMKGDKGRAREYLDEAVQALDAAIKLAEMDRDGPPDAPHSLPAAGFETFKQYVSYYQGLVSLQRRDNRQARELLSYVRDNEKGDVGQAAAGILAKMDEIEAKSPAPKTFDTFLGRLDVQGFFSLGVNYDTNVILLGRDTALPLNIGRKHDFHLDTEAGVSVSRYIDKSEANIGESLSIGVGATTAHSWNVDIHDYDLNQYAGRAFVQWQPVEDCYLGVEYEYASIDLGYDPFISSQRVTPVASHIWRAKDSDDELGRTDVWYNLDIRDYREKASEWRLDRDGLYHAYGIRHIFNLVKSADLWSSYYAQREQESRFFGNRWLNFSLGYIYRDETTDGTEFDLAGHSLLSGVEVPLPWRLAFEVEGIFTWEAYRAPSVFDYRRNERNDFIQHYNFGVVRTFVAKGENAALPTLEIKLRAGAGLTLRNSNVWDRLSQDIYEYNRTVYGLQLSVDF